VSPCCPPTPLVRDSEPHQRQGEREGDDDSLRVLAPFARLRSSCSPVSGDCNQAYGVLTKSKKGPHPRGRTPNGARPIPYRSSPNCKGAETPLQDLSVKTLASSLPLLQSYLCEGGIVSGRLPTTTFLRTAQGLRFTGGVLPRRELRFYTSPPAKIHHVFSQISEKSGESVWGASPPDACQATSNLRCAVG
jgi:hypothetical protein